MIKVKDISDYINEFSPFETQCNWDNCGLLVGDMDKEVKKIGVCLDGTMQTVKSAIENKVDMIVTHHPVIFAPQKNFTKGNIAFEAALNGISIVSAHTCLDCAEDGVNDVLCDIIGVKNTVGVPSDDCAVPMARIGETEEMTAEDFAKKTAEKLDTVCKLVNGKTNVKKVAVCGGSAFDFFFKAVEMGADTYVTGEVKHHELLIAKDLGINLIVAGHYETEKPVMIKLKDKIAARFPETEVILLDEKNPVEYVGR